MKSVILIGDGMTDRPIPALNNQTPLEAARTPTLDLLARISDGGQIQTIPPGMAPGSDVAHLTIFGYDPIRFYTGRAPLEAAGLNVLLNEGDLAFRLNLVTLSREEPFEQKRLLDFCGGNPDTEQGQRLISQLQEKLNDERFTLIAGDHYRHLLIRRQASYPAPSLSLPHEYNGSVIGPQLPVLPELRNLTLRAHQILSEETANGIWLWGAGRKTSLPDYQKTFGASAAVVTASSLVAGIAGLGGMDVIVPAGATGDLNTDYSQKVSAVLSALQTHDRVFLHINAPDECSHRGSVREKLQAIEDLDQKVLYPLLNELSHRTSAYELYVLADHGTSLVTGRHLQDPVPFLHFQCGHRPGHPIPFYSEKNSRQGILLQHSFFRPSES